MKIFFSGNTLALVEPRSGAGVQNTRPWHQRVPEVAGKEYFQSGELRRGGDVLWGPVAAPLKQVKKRVLASRKPNRPGGLNLDP